MRGTDERTGALFSYVDLEARVREDHPLRVIRTVVNEALVTMEREIASLYSETGRPSIAPERLLRAMLLQAFYSIRSERQLMERIEFDLLFRWFVGLGIDDPVWDHSTFSKNRDRLLEGAVAGRFLSAMLAPPRVKRLLSSEHFSVDGTLIEAWASMKSFRPKAEGSDDPEPPGGRNPDANFRGETRSNATHASTTDPDAKLYRKGPGIEAKLCFIDHALMENRSGLLVDTCLTQAGGHAERVAALAMIEPRADRPRAVTLGADRGYDAADFVNELRSRLIAVDERGVTFRWKDYRARDGGHEWIKTMTLAPDEFIRRFLLHVLPDGFHRIRHYGLFASGTRAANIARIRSLLAPASPQTIDPEPARSDEGPAPACPCCGGRLIVERFRRGEIPRMRPTTVRVDTS